MKTMRSIDGKRIFRTTDEKAAEMYHNGDANYATKEEWKKEVRDLNKSTEEPKKKNKSNKPSKAQKRRMRKTLQVFNKYIVITTLLFVINNILIWYQLNSQLVWDWAKGTKAVWISCLMGIPISYLFWIATKWGYIGFGNLWAVRFMGFATSMLTFPIMTWMYLGETITLKTGITIILAIIIMLLQLI